MYQTHSQPKQQQYITLLDKCTQILREDRIWLRNMVKSGHQDAINLFRGLPRNVDMKELQIKLRKYIMRTKEREKQEQLQRFKENMQLPDFVQMAAEKRHQEYFAPTHSSKDHQGRRGPLIQNESNQQERSSFAAKWNNYSHYDPSQNNNHHMESRHFQSINQQIVNNATQSRPLTTSTSKKQWQNNYKPHSFNKNLNYELSNKLSLKSNSTILNNASTSKSRHNLSTSSLHKGTTRDQFKNKSMTNTISNNSSSRRQIVNNDEHQESGRFTNSNFSQGRTSSKNLKQLQNRIYEQLKQFQQNKNKRESQSLNKSFSQRSIQKQTNQKQKSSKKHNPNKSNSQEQQEHVQYSQNLSNPSISTVSKQSIDEILKFKLGNCDFEAYKREQSSVHDHYEDQTINHNRNQESSFSNISHLSHTSDAKVATSSQKKLYYNDSMFPPIQEQTQRDSESQRYPEEPLRFGFNNGGNALKQELEDRHKVVFASFAKGGSSVSNELGLSKQYGQCDNIMLNSFNPQQLASNRQSPNEQLAYQKNISQSLYQSAQKKNDFTENFIESDLHKSIMQSIKKSREMYPLQTINNNTQPQSLIPYRPATSEVVSFSSSLYASTNQQCETIFTSPQLLNECRNFLKKTQEINFQNSGLGSNFNSSHKNTKFQSPTNNQQKKSFNFQVVHGQNNNLIAKQNSDNNLMIKFPQPITITQSITKDYYEHYGESNYSQTKINSLFESKQSSVQKNIQFETYSKPQEMIEMSVDGGNTYGQMLRDEGYDGYMRNSIKQQEYTNNYDKQVSSVKKDEQIVMGHSLRNSSIKRHSQIEETLVANNNKGTIEFSHSHNRSNNNNAVVSHSNNNTYSGQNNDENYRTSEFKQIETQTKIVQGYNNGGIGHLNGDNRELFEMIELEDVIDRLLQANQGNLQMDSTWLKHTIANHCVFQPSVGKTLSRLLHEFIIQPDQIHNFIDLLDVVYAYYKANCPNYRPKKSPAADIYSLLDIQQKGYIVEQDLQSFVEQLQSAGVDNIDEIHHHLQQTFEMADFLSIKKIGFVNLYVIKNQDCFDALWGELQQFQFEVQWGQ